MPAARRAWETGYNFDGEDRDPEHLLVLGGGHHAGGAARPRLPRADEHGAGLEPLRADALRPLRPPAVGRPARPRGRSATDERCRRRHAEFDLCGPLPTGVTVLEASAGTGKTYTIAALAARYVAEGTPLERLLLVTFTRMATGELRDRVRERLVGAEQELSRILAGAPDRRRGPGREPARHRLARGGRAAARPARARRGRLRRRDDRHHPRLLPGGAGRARHRRRRRARHRRSSRTSPISSRRWSTTSTCGAFRPRRARPFARAEALEIARGGRGQPGRRARADRAHPDSAAAMRCRLGRCGPRRARAAQAPAGGHDLRRPADPARTTRSAGPERGRATRAAARPLRRRARRRVPGHRPGAVGDPAPRVRRRRARRSCSIGDPKQAIYAFRGADVYAYLDAARDRRRRGRRCRSTGAATRGCSTPTTPCSATRSSGTRGSSTAGSSRRAGASDAAAARRSAARAPLRVRVAHRDEPTIELTRDGLRPGRLRARARRRATSPPTSSRCCPRASAIEHRTPSGQPDGEEPVDPGHIAVLVRTNTNAALIRAERCTPPASRR